jgi:hypothetical protein
VNVGVIVVDVHVKLERVGAAGLVDTATPPFTVVLPTALSATTVRK